MEVHWANISKSITNPVDKFKEVLLIQVELPIYPEFGFEYGVVVLLKSIW